MYQQNKAKGFNHKIGANTLVGALLYSAESYNDISHTVRIKYTMICHTLFYVIIYDISHRIIQ